MYVKSRENYILFVEMQRSRDLPPTTIGRHVPLTTLPPGGRRAPGRPRSTGAHTTPPSSTPCVPCPTLTHVDADVPLSYTHGSIRAHQSDRPARR